jgi:hypothetical protein
MTLYYDVSNRHEAASDYDEIQAYRLAGYYLYDPNEPLAVTRARNSARAWIAVTQHFNDCGMPSLVPYVADLAIKQLVRGAKRV